MVGSCLCINKSVSTQPLTFRGISLQSCLYKIYSGILNNRLYKYLEQNHSLSNNQNGFREKRSCLDHVYACTELIRNRVKENGKVYALFVDFKSAFDYVDHDLLMYSLRKMNVSGKLARAYETIYSNPGSAINVNGELTEFFRNIVGTKQGDLSSPNLFNVYLQTLLDELDKSELGIVLDDLIVSTLAYADDVVLLAETPENLQKLTDLVYKWSQRWQMMVNIQKTKAVIFRRKRVTPPDVQLYYGKEKIEVVEGYRYLGVFLDAHLTFNQNGENLASAVGRALGGIINKCKNMKNVGYRTFSRLFHSCVVPVMDYGAEIWGKKQKCIEDVQYHAGRYF